MDTHYVLLSLQGIEDTEVNKTGIRNKAYILIEEMDKKQIHSLIDIEQMNNSFNNLFLKVGKC